MTKPVVYFLCTGNSCRSQMAEGWARQLGQDQIVVYSAGIAPHGVNPRAVAVMQETGVDIAHHTSDPIDLDLLHRADYVITLCGDADEACPVTPPHVTRLHWGLPDPARAVGAESEIMAKFREVRDNIHERVRHFLAEELGVAIPPL